MAVEGRRNVWYEGKCAGCGDPHPFCDRVTGVWCALCWPTLVSEPKIGEDGRAIENHFIWSTRRLKKLTSDQS